MTMGSLLSVPLAGYLLCGAGSAQGGLLWAHRKMKWGGGTMKARNMK